MILTLFNRNEESAERQTQLGTMQSYLDSDSDSDNPASSVVGGMAPSRSVHGFEG
jgi:hypothetical protein